MSDNDSDSSFYAWTSIHGDPTESSNSEEDETPIIDKSESEDIALTGDEPELCDHCKALDFEAAAVNEDGTLRSPPRPVGIYSSESFGHFSQFSNPTCPLCRFLIDGFCYNTYPYRSPGYFHFSVDPPFISLYARSGPMSVIISPQADSTKTKSWVSGRRVNAAEIDYQFLKACIDDCAENHDDACTMFKPLNVPGFRVIDCMTKSIVSYPESGAKYVALSYVWGRSGREAKANQRDDFKLPARIPNLVADAITVAHRLGYRYLWVDRYCIPQAQDENSTTERDAQIRSMDLVYANAVCTIIAAVGRGAKDNLPGVSPGHPRIRQPVIKFKGCLLTGIKKPEPEILSSKWSHRGWTYQEGALSRRRLVFTSSQVYFQCQQGQWVEGLDSPLKFGTLSPAIFHMENLVGGGTARETYRSIRDYASRRLTFRDDKQRAFLGVLNRLKSRKPPIQNFLGLPLFPVEYLQVGRNGSDGSTASDTDDLVQALSWTFKFPAKYMLREVGFPSWTWLGWRRKKIESDEYATFAVGEPYHESAAWRNHVQSITVQLSDGRSIPWMRPWEWICDEVEMRSDTSIRITGYLCDLPIELQKQLRGPFWFRDPKSTLRPEQHVYFSPSKREVRPLFGKRRKVEFVSVLLLSRGQSEECWNRTSWNARYLFCLLVLKELPIQHMYERIDAITLEGDEEFRVHPDGQASLGSLCFRPGTVNII